MPPRPAGPVNRASQTEAEAPDAGGEHVTESRRGLPPVAATTIPRPSAETAMAFAIQTGAAACPATTTAAAVPEPRGLVPPEITHVEEFGIDVHSIDFPAVTAAVPAVIEIAIAPPGG
jgi:hypothetical protein